MADENKDVEKKDAEHDSGGSKAATATKTKRAPKKSPAKKPPQPLPPYKVLLHNDDVNDVEHVVHTIVALTPLNTEDAVIRTLEAHETGVALLLTTHKERAELYCEQFKSKGLTVTIEPAS
jgi:ATP-dependent Clp protease adaptor protein ClpS